MAYFSNEGTQIYSGAGSLGADAGPLMSFRDGSLGADAGPLMAFRDGSLGADAGPLMAFRDGSLGADAGPLMAFRDGSLGGCGCGPSLGAAQAANLDMNDPDVVLEIKTLMLLSGGLSPGFNVDTVDPVFGETPEWDQKSTEVASLYVSAVGGALAGSADVTSWFQPPSLYPNTVGIQGMLQLIGFPTATFAPTAPEGPPIRELLPKVTAFAETGATLGGEVIPPEEKGLKPAEMAMIGVGAVGLLGMIWVLSRKRKK